MYDDRYSYIPAPSIAADDAPPEAAEFFAEYCRLSWQAQATHNLDIAIAAGHAWRRFLEAFEEVE